MREAAISPSFAILSAVFGSLDPEKLLFVFVVAVIVFGPDKLPQIAKQIAYLVKKWHEIRDSTLGELKSGFKDFTGSELPSYKTGSIQSFLFEEERGTSDNINKATQGPDGASISPVQDISPGGNGAGVNEPSESDLISVKSVSGANRPIRDHDKESLYSDDNQNLSEDTEENIFIAGSGFYDPSSN
jgi:Sec-independent protein translocase protein TatA